MRIEQIHRAIYRVTTPFDRTGTVFLYLVKGERLALIDTGAADSPRTVLQPALAKIGLSLANVELVLNTHAHLDHSGGNRETQRIANAVIHVHADDLPMAESTAAQIEFHTSPLRVLEFPPEAVQERADHVTRNAGEPAGADVLLKEGGVIDLGSGVRFHVLHCPGHTPGHVAYYWESEGILFTGDAVQGQGARLGSYPYYFDAPRYRRSLRKLQELDCPTLCLGHAFHGGTLMNSPLRAGLEARAFLQDSMEVADTIHRAVGAALQQGPGLSKRETALAALSELLYEIPQLRLRRTGMPLLAGPTLLSHIEAAMEGSYPA